jgi:hypothetical protein
MDLKFVAEMRNNPFDRQSKRRRQADDDCEDAIAECFDLALLMFNS